MPAKPKRAWGALALAVVAILLIAASTAVASDARYEGIAADGSAAFFSTADPLVPGDTDTRRDIYARSFEEGIGYVTREVSIGPTGGNNAFDVQYLGTDESGDKVFFSTAERLTAADKDSTTDIYVRDLNESKTTLVSAGDPSCLGSECGNANSAASAVTDGIVADGKHVFFASEERLSAADEDETADVYVRNLAAGTTTLVSTGSTGGNGTQPAFFLGASADGSKAVFTTHEALVSEDEDSIDDLYLRDLESGETKLVSTPGTCPGSLDCTPVYGGISSNGAHVFFESNERISGGDTDESQDVYDWSGGTAELVSQGPAGGNGKFNALYAGSSDNGSEAFFTTPEQLANTDGDGVQDIYVRSGGTSTELVSEGDPSCSFSNCGNGEFAASLRWVSSDGSSAVFSTAESLTAADEDEAFDVYSRALPGGPTTLVSGADSSCTDPECGSGAHDANFAGASTDGSHLFFVSGEQLSAADGDSATDVYDRSAGATTLVSAGQLTGEGPYTGNGPDDAQLQGVSQDGSRAFFVSKEQITGEDGDSFQDVYLRSSGGTLLVSRGNDASLESELAPPVPLLERTDPESPGASTQPKVIGSEPLAEASIKLYSTPDCSGAPVAVGDAEELAEPGIAVTVAAGSTTSFRATAEAEGFISGCPLVAISYKQQSPVPPPPGEGSGGSGGGSPPVFSPAPAPAPAKTHDGIAYVAPVTRITFGPVFKTRARRPVFRFTDSTGQPGTRFVCRVDRHRWKGCGSPTRLKGLGRGKHVFRVKGINAAGAWEARPTKRRFKLVRR